MVVCGTERARRGPRSLQGANARRRERPGILNPSREMQSTSCSSSWSSTSWPLCTQGGGQPWAGPTAVGGTRVGPEAAPGPGAAQRCTTSPRFQKHQCLRPPCLHWPPSQLPRFPVIQKDQDSELCSFSTPTSPPLQRLPGDRELTRRRWPWGWGKRTLATGLGRSWSLEDEFNVQTSEATFQMEAGNAPWLRG